MSADAPNFAPTADNDASIRQDDYRGYIGWLAERKIRGFCGTIDENGVYLSKVYQGNASLAESITADYNGRFLLELIQNANDVHPSGRGDGEIEVVFDQREGHGTLYVANRGLAFSQENVNALCDMGLSSKPPGESIGNKGLGFRSVHHITDTPFIYSQTDAQGARDCFEGFCFTFASDDDLAALIANPVHRALAYQDLPLFHVPVWLDVQPDAVKAFSRRGFATVICLPLRDEAASRAVRDEIEAIKDQTVPMLLFLTRLKRLSVRVTGADDPDYGSFSLTRSEVPVVSRDHNLAVVDLGKPGRFLVARQHVSEGAMRAAIADGIGRKQLHGHWGQWKGDGEVALAVRLDGVITDPRLYAFLPMGQQAVSPFRGHLHGSFFPTSNRKGLDASIELNALLLAEAATLAAGTIAWMAQSPLATTPSDPLDSAARAYAVTDLMSWRKTNSLNTREDLAAEVAARIAERLDVSDLDDAPVVPSLGMQGKALSIVWSTPARARPWHYMQETFSAEVAAAHAARMSVAPIWPGLSKRIEWLNEFLLRHCKRYLDAPAPAERAELVVRVAADLEAVQPVPIVRWTAFYSDLVTFLERQAVALAGRRILLCADGRIHRTLQPSVDLTDGVRRVRIRRRREAVAGVFAPPARQAAPDDSDLLKPPGSLATDFAFLSDKLDWYEALAPARQFLENAKLVAAFDREAVLTHLSRVLRQDERKGVRADGLRWAFQIWRQPRESGRPVKLQPQQHRFFVPTVDGEFIEANEAIFSASWPDATSGPLLQQFLSSAPRGLDDLVELSARRLAPRSHHAFKGKRAEHLWVDFLIELGVQQGLQPIAKKLSGPVPAYRMRSFAFCGDLGITQGAAASWKGYIEARSGTAIDFQSTTDYVVKGDIWWLPGQGDLNHFTYECRTFYAKLIIGWLEKTTQSYWIIEVHHRHFVNADTRLWPTPVAAFLQSAHWIPADEPWADGPKQVLCRAADIWLAPDTAGERFLPFLVRPTIPVLRLLEGATRELINALCNLTGLRVLNRTSTLALQAEFLAQQYAKGGFDRYFEPHFLNLYYKTWVLLADHFAARGREQRGITAPQTLLVRRGGDPEVLRMPAPDVRQEEPVYVRDGDNETVASLLEAGHRILFDARAPQPGRIGALLRGLYGPRVRMISEVDCEMTADGQEIGTGRVAPVLQWCPRLRALTAIAMEALKGTDLQRLPADRSLIIVRLERTLLQRVGTISFRVDGVEIVPETGGDRAYALRLQGGERIVAVRSIDTFSWSVIDESLGAICEAIGQPPLEPHLRLLIRELARRGAQVDEHPTDALELDWLCRELRLGEVAKRAVRQTLGARLERHLPWLRAIVHLAGGMDAVNCFARDEAAAIKAPSLLRDILSPWLKNLGLNADAVLDACRRALSVAELRESLELDFASMNESLVAVHATPDTYPQLHVSQVASFVQEHELEIVDALRSAYAQLLVRNQCAPGYAKARDEARSLAPDGAWLLRYREIPQEVIGVHVDNWLRGMGAQARGANPYHLQPVADVRRLNNAAIAKFIATAGPLVNAWCGKADRLASELWRNSDGGVAELRVQLDKAGIFDFTGLDDESLLEWCAIVEAWPDRMPLSLEREALGLVDADFDVEKRKTAAAAEARRREARSITFNGRRIDPDEADWPALAEELSTKLSAAMLATPLGARADFLPAKERKPGSAQTGGKGAARLHPSRAPRMPSQATDMIGRLGELAVYHWLRSRLRQQDIDAAWRSANAFPFTGRVGSDSLGYDFEVSFRNQIWQIEVKASLNDPCAFELGETEVRAGRIAARSRSGVQYVIAYVSNLGQPEHARVEVLPNPMSEEGDAVFNLLGEGLRFSFRRALGS